jgi:hypothetical protein
VKLDATMQWDAKDKNAFWGRRQVNVLGLYDDQSLAVVNIAQSL